VRVTLPNRDSGSEQNRDWGNFNVEFVIFQTVPLYDIGHRSLLRINCDQKPKTTEEHPIPIRIIKHDTEEAQTLEWILHVKNYQLKLDKHRCVGCQICSLACPKEAIKLEKQFKVSGKKAEKAKIDFDLAKCNFCGVCDIMCPYGAVKVTVNGEHLLSIIEKQSFPQLIRNIQVDTRKYPVKSGGSENACPLNLVTVELLTADGKPVRDVDLLTAEEQAELQVSINIDKEHCPCCRVCEIKLPEGVMRVHKFIQGKIEVRPEKCPEGCADCLNVCPITGALYLSNDGMVHVNERFCVYCGACKAVCPVEGALELERTRLSHTPIKSGAWNKALEKVTSPTVLSKELKAKSQLKAIEAVEKLLTPKGAC
jgi:formate hydrogenlyase subunit 6/NADH:ubiquinone oxidoreductase subunit I